MVSVINKRYKITWISMSKVQEFEHLPSKSASPIPTMMMDRGSEAAYIHTINISAPYQKKRSYNIPGITVANLDTVS